MDTTKSGEYEKPISKAILITGKFYGKKKRKLCQTHFFLNFIRHTYIQGCHFTWT